MTGYKILLIEDHRELAETVGAFLEASGATVAVSYTHLTLPTKA